jgi:primosomal protein N' (replication factor Y)
LITEFVDVIIPQSVPNALTYRVPRELTGTIQLGTRVIVPLGKTKLVTGIVRALHQKAPGTYEAKYLDVVLDDSPIVNEIQLSFWQWISDYYLCNPGDVLNASLPGAFKLSSESRYLLNQAVLDDDANIKGEVADKLNDKEYLVIEALQIRNVLSLIEIQELLSIKTVQPIIKSLIEKGFMVIEQAIQEKFIPKSETYLTLHPQYQSQSSLQELMNQLEKRAFKQLEILLKYLQLSNIPQLHFPELRKKQLLLGLTNADSVLQTMVSKGYFVSVSKQVDRLVFDGNIVGLKTLNEIQKSAYDEISLHFKSSKVCLLHGITGSGKTEVYIHLMRDAIAQGKQVLYLLPEIALTAQIIVRLQKAFGKKVGVYHSRYSENERVEVWNRLLHSDEENTYDIILGARSAVFLPFSKLGLVIVDEEHDSSYKQFEPAPRYNARDSAIYLASLHRANVLLGSATPSVESYYHATSGKYSLVQLKNRFGNAQLPEVKVVMTKRSGKNESSDYFFTETLLDTISQKLAQKKQVILFQNRRGFAPQLECKQCAYVPHCTNCDVSLTYHKAANILKCHYCGYSAIPTPSCQQCGSNYILMKGVGTEKVEEELQVHFQEARIARMDLDTTRTRSAFQKLIYEFEEQNIEILIGTQMVTKGLDFENVGLVGVINADSLMNYPNFRSIERCFQLLTQVSGRAGRAGDKGEVIIQTSNPTHTIIKQVIDNNFKEFFHYQIEERKQFLYPPFSRLIRINLQCKTIELLDDAAEELSKKLRGEFGKRVLGPEYPMIKRLRSMHHKNILIKIENTISITKSKAFLMKQINEFQQNTSFKGVRLVIDVDIYD